MEVSIFVFGLVHSHDETQRSVQKTLYVYTSYMNIADFVYIGNELEIE